LKATQKLRQLLARQGVIQAGGVADAGQARLVERVGYPAVYVSGSYVNHTRGLPDGSLTLSEIAQRLSEITDRTSLPVIADADEGFGGILKIDRTVRMFERAGVAGLHLEDMATKKHGHPMSLEDALVNLQVAIDARIDPDFVIIARTDAMAPWRTGLSENLKACEEEAFQRCLAYCEAGADLVMPLFASTAWIKKYGPQLPKPMLLLPPELSVEELEPYNVKVVIYASSMLTRAHHFMEKQFASWLNQGMFDATEQDLIDRYDANLLVGMKEKEALLAKYGK